MTAELMIKLLAIATVLALAYWVLRWFQTLRPEELAMKVWAAFGPYDSAERAATSLRWASRAVFGKTEAINHEKWVNSHIQNFRDWETNGCFEKMQNVMRSGLLLTARGHDFEAACQRFRDEAMADATEIMGVLNEDLEKTGHKLEPVKLSDGTYSVAYKKIWSDDEIQRKERETGEAVLNAIGKNLLEDQSSEAKQLLSFLAVVYQTNICEALEAPKDVGISWVACLEIQDKDPNSETAKTFRVLNNAWDSNKCDIKTERIELHLSKEAFTKTAIEKTAEDIERIFSSDQACSEYTGARVIRKKGGEAIAEFREHMIDKVQEIVTNSNPFIAIRKALINSMESYIRNSAFFWEEFRDRRENIYRQLNASGAELNDEIAASFAMWADAESIFLRLLQKSMFENVSQDDWWARYSPLYEEYIKNLYRAALAQSEGNIDSMHALMVKATKETTEKFKSKLFESE